jgi:hypothetical protein
MTTQQTVISSAHAKRTNVYGLAWKEWRENKILIFWPIPLLVIFFCALVSIQNLTRHGQPLLIDISLNVGLMDAAWVLSALLCGASLYSQELGNGTGQFLASLPFSKRQIWGTKIFCGLLQHAGAVIAATLTALLLNFIADRMGIVDPKSLPVGSLIPPSMRDSLHLLVLPTIAIFSFAACITFVVDRPMNTVIISLIGSAAAFSIFMQLLYGNGGRNIDPRVPWVICYITTAVLFAISYLLYARREKLKEYRMILLPIIISWLMGLILILMTLILCYFWLTS